MKRSVLILASAFISMILVGCGGTPTPPKNYSYSEVVEHNLKAQDAYAKSKMWLVESYVDSKAVIEYDNAETHTTMGKGINKNVDFGMMRYNDVKYVIKIESKDNRSKITINNMFQSYYDTLLKKRQKYRMWKDDDFNTFKNVIKTSIINEYKGFLNNNVEKSSKW